MMITKLEPFDLGTDRQGRCDGEARTQSERRLASGCFGRERRAAIGILSFGAPDERARFRKDHRTPADWECAQDGDIESAELQFTVRDWHPAEAPCIQQLPEINVRKLGPDIAMELVTSEDLIALVLFI